MRRKNRVNLPHLRLPPKVIPLFRVSVFSAAPPATASATFTPTRTRSSGRSGCTELAGLFGFELGGLTHRSNIFFGARTLGRSIDFSCDKQKRENDRGEENGSLGKAEMASRYLDYWRRSCCSRPSVRRSLLRIVACTCRCTCGAKKAWLGRSQGGLVAAAGEAGGCLMTRSRDTLYRQRGHRAPGTVPARGEGALCFLGVAPPVLMMEVRPWSAEMTTPSGSASTRGSKRPV
jgi:hypothetical protein